MSSPLGLLFLARAERGLRYLEFMDRKSLKRMIGAHADALPEASWTPSLLDLKPVVDELEAYFSGMRTEFTVPLDPAGSEFQFAVWSALRRIPYGETRAYGEIARAIGQPKASRAVGLANNQNPIAIIVPCHRVVGADGSLVGYGGGIARKRWLLDHEARFAQPLGRTGDLFGGTAVAVGPPVVRARAAAEKARRVAPRAGARSKLAAAKKAGVTSRRRAGSATRARSSVRSATRTAAKRRVAASGRSTRHRATR